MSKKSDEKYLSDMLQYAREAHAMAAGADREEFFTNRQLQLAVMHLVQIVGEAASHTNTATRTALPSLPWPRIIGMRHHLVHGYGDIDVAIVWDVVENDLPALIAALEQSPPI
jgi:uncharacterized protein with HEPN domain